MRILDDKKKLTKDGEKVLLATLIHCIISFFTDRLVFYDTYPVKFIFVLLLFGFWYVIFNTIRNIRSGDRETIEFIKIMLPFLIVFTVYIIMIWPGNWICDDMSVYRRARMGVFDHWQSFLTSLFYMLAMMFIPCAGGVVIVQLLIISVISSYIIKTVKKNFPSGKLAVLLYIPFFLFPVLYLDAHPLRLTLYAYLDLLFITLFADSYRNRTISTKRICAMVFTAVLLTGWRTEGIYYLILCPVLFLLLFIKIANAKQKALFCTSFAAASVLVLFIQNSSGDEAVDYSKTAFLYPLLPLTERAYKENDTAFLEATDKIYDVQLLLYGAEHGISGEVLYWDHHLSRDGESDEDYNEFKKQYLLACIKYYDTFLQERIQTFMSTTESRFNEYFARQFDEVNIAFYSQNPVPDYIEDVRIAVLGTLTIQDYPFMKALWHPVIPAAFMLLFTVFCAVRRKLAYAAILAVSLVKSGLVFITAPSTYFMYYFPVYLCGYFCLFFAIYFCAARKRGQQQVPLKKSETN